jgi:hypothetical protein
MSLYLLEEICEGCEHAEWYTTKDGRTILDRCKKDCTSTTDAVTGECEDRD